MLTQSKKYPVTTAQKIGILKVTVIMRKTPVKSIKIEA
tara:strand:- start:411 stop:524 length:114 start_codon:yes stop_codon:yes gene_type:complete